MPLWIVYTGMRRIEPQYIRQYRKERLILLCLSVLLNWRFDVTEKESLTLFFVYGISPPYD